MGRIEIDLFATLDLVAQAPGSPQEDPEGGFKFGGWQAPFSDDVVGEQIVAGIAALDALLLGHKTYDIFAGYWPRKEDDFANGIAGIFNRVPKYVASRSRLNLDGSVRRRSDQILRQRHAKFAIGTRTST